MFHNNSEESWSRRALGSEAGASLGTLVCGVLKNEQALLERAARIMKSVGESWDLGEVRRWKECAGNREYLICLRNHKSDQGASLKSLARLDFFSLCSMSIITEKDRNDSKIFF